MKVILGIKVMCGQTAWTMALYQPGYIQLILDDFSMADCNPVSTLMEQNVRLSKTMCLETPEEKAHMVKVPYCELIRKLLYLAVATCPNISYTMVSFADLLRTLAVSTGVQLSISFDTSRTPLALSSFT